MGNELSDTEQRLIVLETKLELLTENVTNAILRLEKKLDEYSRNYVTRDVLEEKLKSMGKEIETLKEEKKTNKQLVPAWGQTIMAVAAVVVAVVALFK
jgi:dynactin complex subunit